MLIKIKGKFAGKKILQSETINLIACRKNEKKNLFSFISVKKIEC